MAEESVRVASTIKQQIGPMALMSTGAHDFVATDKGLRFKVGGVQRWVEVDLDRGSDTYDVTVFRIKRGTYDRVLEYEASNVYADDLARIIRKEGDRAGASRRRTRNATPEQRRRGMR